jgi:hypothetical protein
LLSTVIQPGAKGSSKWAGGGAADCAARCDRAGINTAISASAVTRKKGRIDSPAVLNGTKFGRTKVLPYER